MKEVLEHLTSKDYITREETLRFIDRKSNDVMQSQRAEASRLETLIDELREDIEEIRERVEVLNEYAEHASKRAKSNEKELDMARRAHNNVHDRIEALDVDLRGLEEKVDKRDSALFSF